MLTLIAVSVFAGPSFSDEPLTNRLQLINTANYGEGGGSGAGNLPLSEEISSGIYDEVCKDYVAAHAVELTGTFKVKGFGTKIFILENAVDSENNKLNEVSLYIDRSKRNEFLKLRNRNIMVKGVYYDNTFLVFEYAEC